MTATNAHHSEGTVRVPVEIELTGCASYALVDGVAAWRAYDLERGNGLLARLVVDLETPEALCTSMPMGPSRRLATLSTRELAGLWHPGPVGRQRGPR